MRLPGRVGAACPRTALVPIDRLAGLGAAVGAGAGTADTLRWPGGPTTRAHVLSGPGRDEPGAPMAPGDTRAGRGHPALAVGPLESLAFRRPRTSGGPETGTGGAGKDGHVPLHHCTVTVCVLFSLGGEFRTGRDLSGLRLHVVSPRLFAFRARGQAAVDGVTIRVCEWGSELPG